MFVRARTNEEKLQHRQLISTMRVHGTIVEK